MGLYDTLSGLIIGEWAADNTSLSNGASVSSWAQTGNGSSSDALVQGTGSRQPVFHSNWNSTGYAAVKFDGTDDFLACSPSANSFHVLVVATHDGNASTSALCSRSGTGGYFHWLYRSSTTSLIFGDSIGRSSMSYWQSGRNAVALSAQGNFAGSISRESSVINFNATARNTVAGGSFCVGAYASSNFYSPAAIHHVLLLGNAGRAAVEQALAQLRDRWNITDGDAGDPVASGGSTPRNPFTQSVIG